MGNSKSSLIFESSISSMKQQVHMEDGAQVIFLALPEDIFKKILHFADPADFETLLTLLIVCKHFAVVVFEELLLPRIVSDNFPNRPLSKFISNVVRGKQSIYFRRSVKLLVPAQVVPDNLSIHMFTDTEEEQIKSDNVRSMIICLHFRQNNYFHIQKFLEFLLKEEHFKGLENLMLTGIPFFQDLQSSLENLNVVELNIRSFTNHSGDDDPIQNPSYTNLPLNFSKMKHLRKLYATCLGRNGQMSLPGQLEDLVVYCIDQTKGKVSSDQTYKICPSNYSHLKHL